MNKLHIRRRWVLLILGLLVVAAAGGTVALVLLKKEKQVDYSYLCLSDEIGMELKTNYPNFGPEDSMQMVDLINRIIATPHHKESVNCLYVVGEHSGYMGNPSQAYNYFDELLRLNESSSKWVDISISQEQPGDIEISRDFFKAQSERTLNDSAARPLPSLEAQQ